MLSQPSAIDGNLWPGYGDFLQHMAERHPQVEVMLDLCYVGLLARDYAIEIGYPNIVRLFFSLSKIFGVYYHRMGGVFSKREIPGLCASGSAAIRWSNRTRAGSPARRRRAWTGRLY
jgi:hypothetical protein